MERGEVLTDAFDGLEVLGLTDERLKQGEIIKRDGLAYFRI
jgi:hypothetical protein